MCFRLLYQYDMLARECSLSVDWAESVVYLFGTYGVWRVEQDYIMIDVRPGLGDCVLEFAFRTKHSKYSLAIYRMLSESGSPVGGLLA